MKKDDAFVVWVIFIFLLLAASFLFDVWGKERKPVQHPLVEEKHFSKDPVRDYRGEAKTSWQGEAYDCLSCHAHLEVSDVQKSFYSAHRDIVLKHGANQDCKSCHSQTDKNHLVGPRGQNISFKRSEQTCLKCHGPIYRDWENGVHGRMQNYWDHSKQTKPEKLTCVQCHDPHQPKFPPMEPAPAPHRYQYEDELARMEKEEISHG